MTAYTDTIDETIGSAQADVTLWSLNAGAAEVLGVSPGLGVYRAWLDTLSETLGQAEALSTLPGVVLLEVLGVSEATVAGLVFSYGAADTFGSSDTLIVGQPVDLTDTVGLSLAQVVQQVWTLAETLGLTDALSGAATYNLSVGDAARLADSLANFFHLELSDEVSLEELLTPAYKGRVTLDETVGLAEELAPRLLLHASLAEGVGMEPAEAIQALYSGTLSDEIQFTAGYLAPDGSFTTWAVNTRTGAVTEYENFAFNSFARVGNKYIAGSPSGLYELTGDTDAGDDIIAVLKGAYMQFGGTKLSRLKEAYIATLGEGRFVLKIETLDGATYTYQADTRDGRSTKVHMGKGQRSRYFAWTLTSAGQDFDLDTLEFVPIAVDRRV